MSSATPLQNTNIHFKSPSEYAERQGAPVDAFVKHGYDSQFIIHQGRPAWRFKTAGGYRYRFMDGDPQKHKYTSTYGYKICWFGLDEALQISQQTGIPLIMVNGEAGVVVGQYYGLPVFCLSGGELTKITVAQMKNLSEGYTGSVVITLDCDTAGRNGAQQRGRQLKEAGFTVQILDLQLDDKGDIADFCKQHGNTVARILFTLPEVPLIVPRENRSLHSIKTVRTNSDSHYDEFVETQVIPALEKAGIRRGKKHGFCINPNHKEKHPSARIGERGVYICTCGCHSMNVVAGWLDLDYKTWVQSKYPQKQAARKTPITPKPAVAKQVKNTRKVIEHISDDLPPHEIVKHRTLLIEGGTGLGKSHAVGEYANSLDEEQIITCASQLRTLVSALNKYIHNATHYEDTTAQHQYLLSHANRLLTSISSLPKFERQDSDLVVIDELAGVLKFIVSSPIFKGSEALTVYRTAKQVIMSAKQMIGMDANLSQIEIDWINRIRGNDVVVKKYKRKGKRGTFILLKNRNTALWQIKKMLERKRGQVYVACSSETNASEVDVLFNKGYKTFKITRDTSNTRDFKRFLQDPSFRAEFALIIYDPAMLAGVDISEPVYALVALIDRMPLAPEDAIQLVGRVRNPKHRYAVIPAFSEGYTTPTADELKKQRIQYEYWTAKQTGQAPTLDSDYLEMLDLWSRYEERRQYEVAHWYTSFIQRLAYNGFDVKVCHGEVRKELGIALRHWRSLRKEQDWEFVYEADGLALEDVELERLRARGQEITHDLRLRNIRYKIEMAIGQRKLTAQDNDLMHPQKRAALQRAIIRKNDASLAYDKVESLEGIPLQQRRYHKVHDAALRQLFKLLRFDHEPQPDEALLQYFEDERPSAELEDRFSALVSDDATRLLKHLGHQTENANTVIGRTKWLLNYLWGIKPDSVRIGRGAARHTIYLLSAYKITYLIQRRARAAESLRLKQQNACTTNLPNSSSNRFAVQPPKSQSSGTQHTYDPSSIAPVSRLAQTNILIPRPSQAAINAQSPQVRPIN